MSFPRENTTQFIFTRQDLPEHSKNSLAIMWEDSKKEKFCDVYLIAGVDGKKLAAHRIILAAVNDFFRSMFSSPFQEAVDKVFTFKNISFEILELLVQYCYTGTIEINEDNVLQLLPQVQSMFFTELVEACSNFLIKSLNPKNCLNIAQNATLYNCEHLLNKAEEYMKQNFLNIVQTEEFLQWDVEQVEEYFSCDKITVKNEKDVLEAMMRWVDYDHDARKSAIDKLFPTIRIQHIDSSFLLDLRVYRNDKEWYYEMVDNALKQYKTDKSLIKMPERTGAKENRIILVCHHSIGIYNPITDIVEYEYPVSFVRSSCYYAAAYTDEEVFLFGEFNNIFSFNLIKKTWTNIPPLQTRREFCAVIALNSYVYVVGGEETNTVERYDFLVNGWSYVASMNESRSHPSIAVLDGKIYVMGGCKGLKCLHSVECYDPKSNTWDYRAPMTEKKIKAKAVVYGGEIYVIGGVGETYWDVFAYVEKYTPATDSWTVVALIKNRRFDLGACLYDNKIIVFGGCDRVQWISSIEEFDPATNKSKESKTNLANRWLLVDIFPYLYVDNKD